MGFFRKRTDCTLEEINLRLHELEIQPLRELDEIKTEAVNKVIIELKKAEARSNKIFTERQQGLYHLVDQLEERIMTLEAKYEFSKPRKVSKK